jgi:hypothetical protein
MMNNNRSEQPRQTRQVAPIIISSMINNQSYNNNLNLNNNDNIIAALIRRIRIIATHSRSPQRYSCSSSS